jgi:hypothetical protein
MIGLLFPKLGKRTRKIREGLKRKKRLSSSKTPIRRSRKPIASKSVFKAFDPLGRRSKRYRSDAEVWAFAMTKKAERLANRTNAEIRFCEMLDDLAVDYEPEAIIQNGDSFVLIDVLVKKPHVVAFEIDGSAHTRQKKYDIQRDRWLANKRGIRTFRFTNKQIYKDLGFVRQTVIEVLDL